MAQPRDAPRALVAWSGGKDAFLALGSAPAAGVRVVGLLTTATEGTDRTTMHGVRLELVRAQARMLGLPLRVVDLPPDCVNEEYERRMREAMGAAAAEGVTHVVHGDIRLEDVRAFRDRRLAKAGLHGVYPLWGGRTDALAHRFLQGGHEAFVVCIDGDVLPASFAGRLYDDAFLADLPPGVDPCGEDGEFHTFVHASPVFRAPIPCRVGRRWSEGRFHRADLVPGDVSSAPPRNPDLTGVPLHDGF